VGEERFFVADWEEDGDEDDVYRARGNHAVCEGINAAHETGVSREARGKALPECRACEAIAFLRLVTRCMIVIERK
jgi:hypothetical protein